MISRKVKCLVIACNTISANALPEIKKASPVPVFDVITPILKKLDGQKAVVIGTKATINSGIYPIPGKACPLFVPLVEEGFANSEMAVAAAKYYLLPLKKTERLILGCTHFPIMKKAIEKVVGKKVTVTDPAEELARVIQDSIEPNINRGERKFLVTDSVEKAREVAGNFWPQSLKDEWRQVKL